MAFKFKMHSFLPPVNDVNTIIECGWGGGGGAAVVFQGAGVGAPIVKATKAYKSSIEWSIQYCS